MMTNEIPVNITEDHGGRELECTLLLMSLQNAGKDYYASLTSCCTRLLTALYIHAMSQTNQK